MYSYTKEGKIVGNVARMERICINMTVGNTKRKIFRVLSVFRETQLKAHLNKLSRIRLIPDTDQERDVIK